MQGLIIPTLLVAACLAITGVRTEKYDRDFSGADVFQAIDIRTFDLRNRPVVSHATYARGDRVPPVYGDSEMDKLEDFLRKTINSENPLKNLDTVVESLVEDYKNNGPSRTPSSDAKRLVAALSTLEGENLCNYYGFRIILNNLNALDLYPESVKEKKLTGRLDKIFEHFIHERAKNCRQVYFDKFEELSANRDEKMMRRLNLLLKGAIETLMSKKYKNEEGKPCVERLFIEAAHGVSVYFMLEPPYIYEAIKDSVESELNDGPLDKVGPGDKRGSEEARRRKLGQIFDEMVFKPCRYIKERFGPDVIEPALFDIKISKHEFDTSRVDFYEALLKDRLCSINLSSARDKFVDYVENGSV